MSDLFVTGSSLKNKSKDEDFLNPKQKATELSSQISWVITQRKKDVLEEVLELRQHKSKQVRRKVVDAVSQLGTTEDLETLTSWQLQESDRQTWLAIESAIDRLKRGELGQDRSQSERVFSISEAMKLIKNTVSEKEFVLEGELAEVRLTRNLYWIALKDVEETRLDALLLNHRAVRAGFPLNEGLKVRITGRFKISNKSSKLYFDIQTIELTGEGELMRNLEMLKQKLIQEGLFDTERKQQPIRLPQRVLLIASPESAAITDFCRVLGSRRNGVEIYVLPIKTQGVGAEFEVLSQLNRTNQLIDEYRLDTVIMSRGGGSKDDLMVFNSEKVVRAIATIKKPTIVAIGHERDTTFAELVADVRASTPSQAAELTSWSTEQTMLLLGSFSEQAQRIFQQRSNEYDNYAKTSAQYIYQKTFQQVKHFQSQARNIDTVAFSLIGSIKLFLQRATSSIQQKLSTDLQTQRNQFSIIPDLAESVRQRTQEYRYTLQTSVAEIKSRSPRHILNLGYAVIKQDKHIIGSIDQLNLDQSYQVIMQDGTAQVNPGATSVKKNKQSTSEEDS